MSVHRTVLPVVVAARPVRPGIVFVCGVVIIVIVDTTVVELVLAARALHFVLLLRPKLMVMMVLVLLHGRATTAPERPWIAEPGRALFHQRAVEIVHAGRVALAWFSVRFSLQCVAGTLARRR